jgi:hypothetical protein
VIRLFDKELEAKKMQDETINRLTLKIKSENKVFDQIADAFTFLACRINELERKITLFEDDKSAQITTVRRKDSPMEMAHETRSHVDTNTAARWLNRKPQTLRSWASLENGPLYLRG